MKIVADIIQARKIIDRARRDDKTVGLVPTMGALHRGHLSLVQRSRQECDFTAVSIFVNPAQFGPGEDLDNYPRSFDADCRDCRELGVDLIFAPTVAEMYPRENLTWINVVRLSEHLCGTARPGHFRGVCTVVAKLCNIILPDRAYFGQKDAQQLAVIRRMVADLNMPVEIVPCPTVREPDGLAMSTRNEYLDADQRRQARCLSQALDHAAELIAAGQVNAATLIDAMRAVIAQQDQAHIDYISLVDADLLQPLTTLDRPALIALAVKIGPARLIDNILVAPPADKL